MDDNLIKIPPLSKKYTDFYGHTVHLFSEVSLNIKKGKLNTILAPKGTGKTSLLHMIAGTEEKNNSKNEKTIFIPKKPSSFPWLNVRENILFNQKNIDNNNIISIIKLVGLDGYEDHFPNNSSIVFRFRITLARAISNNPDIILIDETISSVPIDRRFDLYFLLRNVVLETGITILYSSSSLFESIRLSDRILYFKNITSGELIEKTILLDEETRFDKNSYLNISDYFTENEILSFKNI